MDDQFNPFLKGMMNKGPKIEDLEQMACDGENEDGELCGNGVFDQYYRMYRLSAINSPSGKAQVFHVPVFACAGCGKILDIKKIESTEEPVDNSENNQDNK